MAKAKEYKVLVNWTHPKGVSVTHRLHSGFNKEEAEYCFRNALYLQENGILSKECSIRFFDGFKLRDAKGGFIHE